VIPFAFQSAPVRAIDQDGEIWFVATDVAKALGYTNITDTLKKHVDDEDRSIVSIGRQGDTNIINESGLYSLILRSKKPEAKAFKRWVTAEVLPAIRRTGRYEANQAPALPPPLTPAQQRHVQQL